MMTSENRQFDAAGRVRVRLMDVTERESCYRALQSRDSRFDGVLFIGVTSTGVYCRPVCPVRTPQLRHCRFFASAAAAQHAGFRPCLRCRPETSPDLPSWRGTSNTVSRALALIADGALDGDARVGAIAERLGLGDRQLRRLFMVHLGAPPVAVAQTRRVLFAGRLIRETPMPMAEIALAAGFRSVRRFNEVFRHLFGRPPGALRRAAVAHSQRADSDVTLHVRYRPPYDWQSMLDYLQARAIAGVEAVSNGSYYRTVEIDGGLGSIRVFHLPKQRSLAVSVRLASLCSLPAVMSRVRRVFDTAADISTIGDHLSRDPRLAPLVARRPGLRAPGGWDGFELAARAVLGQQVSLAAARRLVGALVVRHGTPVSSVHALHPALTHAFPAAQAIATATDIGLKSPASRQAALRALANTALGDADLFRPRGSIDEALGSLLAIRGIGAWTAEYIALRALREMDAFPASDAGLLRAAHLLGLERPTPGRLLERAEAWRPWRAYAAQHLWVADASVRPTRSRA